MNTRVTIAKRLSVAASLSMAFAIGLASCQSDARSKVTLRGAGATLPAPLYTSWFQRFEKDNARVDIQYDAVGSGDGIQQFIDQAVDFAATDSPLTPEERAQLEGDRGNVIQIPTVSISVVMAYNLPGIDTLNLSREAYCGIAAGQITQWNDEAIAQANPEVALPAMPVTFVHRADSSGTTYIFSNHLNQACDQWNAGIGKTVDWATDVDAPGNLGMTAMIQQTEGAIGYIGFTHAEQAALPMANLQNQAGVFIEPSPNAAELATAIADVPEDIALDFPDPEGVDAYPIVGLTYLLMYEKYASAETAIALHNLVSWSQADGRMIADVLGYGPLSQALADRVEEIMDTYFVQAPSSDDAVSL